MSEDLTATIAQVEQQEHDLLFGRFTHDDAWQLGCLLVELATERDLPVTIDVRRGRQQVFHAARPGTAADNDRWVERKVRVVEQFGASSYLIGLRLRDKGTSLKKLGLPSAEYAAHGGAFPVQIEGVGVVGVVTVSGLPQADDHALVVEAIRSFLA
ncbi:heme-degrading domain-containing protein [Cellulomonas soli]|uniref:heme-degrading domain-containing protein n=1 Tax=Cellulomonas soli TaxID=931535 RepID=UPI003F874518